MTANQIAKEANNISIKRDERNYEINTRVAEETERHNKAIEDYNNQQLEVSTRLSEVQRDAQKETERHNKWLENWQANYDFWLREREVRTHEDQVTINQNLAYLEEQKVEAEVKYKDRMADLSELHSQYESKMAEISDFMAQSEDEYRRIQNWATGERVKIEQWGKRIEERKLEYEDLWKHENFDIMRASNQIARDTYVSQRDFQWAEFLWNKEQQSRVLQNQFNIAELTYSAKMSELAFEREKWDKQDKLISAQIFNQYAYGLFGKSGAIPGTFDLFKPIVGGLHGTSKIKTAAEIAQSLFTD